MHTDNEFRSLNWWNDFHVNKIIWAFDAWDPWFALHWKCPLWERSLLAGYHSKKGPPTPFGTSRHLTHVFGQEQSQWSNWFSDSLIVSVYLVYFRQAAENAVWLLLNCIIWPPGTSSFIYSLLPRVMSFTFPPPCTQLSPIIKVLLFLFSSPSLLSF